MPGGGRAHARRQGRLVDESAQLARVVSRVVALHEEAGDAVAHGDRKAADRRGEHRCPGRLRLYGDQAEGLAVGGHDEDGRGPEPVGELLLAHRRAEPYDIGDAEPGGELLQTLGFGEAAAARAADDRHDDPGAQLRALVEQDRHGPQQDVRGLEGLYAAREERDQGVLREAEAGAGGGAAVGGAEAVEVHAGVDHGDLGGVGRVVPDEFVGLLVGVGDEPVRGGDDLRLADHAGGGLGGVAVGQVGVLDLGHGVHGMHQGDAPALGGEPADVAGEPVVGVDEVVVAGAVAGPGLHHAVREGAQLGREVLLGEALVGPRVDVPDEDARGELDRGREPARRRPGEDLDLDVDRGQALGQLHDVDVHAAGVTGAGLVER